MKRMRKMMALVLAVMTIMAFSVPSMVFADETTPTKHTVSTESKTHTYEVYQIFRGQFDAESGQLQNLKYGTNAATGTPGSSVTASDMEGLAAIEAKTYTNDQAKIGDLTPFVNLSSNPVATLGKDGDASVDLEEGYYIIKDKDGTADNFKPDTYTLYLFKVLDDDLTITPKDGTTTVDKTVTEKNDTTATVTAEKKGADYDQGDSIPYSINITFAKNVTDYKKYTVNLTDTLSNGLTPPAQTDISWTLKDKQGNVLAESDGEPALALGTVTVSVDGQTITAGYSLETTGNPKQAIGTLTNAAKLNEAVLTISYEAVLNSNAVVGEEGNPNTYKIQYTNNPNGDDTGVTPEEEVKVYTYEIEIEKKDGNDQPLAGAGFTLYKEVAGTTTGEGNSATTTYPEGAMTGAAIKAGFEEGSKINASKLNDAKYYVPISMTEATETGKVTHKTDTTIDAGTYVLIETTVPDGYNAYEGDTIVVTSNIDATTGALTSLSATGPTGITATKNDGQIKAGVVNQSGSTLPSTGGMGTTIFYILGALLVVGCGIVLVSKKRTSDK